MACFAHFDSQIHSQILWNGCLIWLTSYRYQKFKGKSTPNSGHKFPKTDIVQHEWSKVYCSGSSSLRCIYALSRHTLTQRNVWQSLGDQPAAKVSGQPTDAQGFVDATQFFSNTHKKQWDEIMSRHTLTQRNCPAAAIVDAFLFFQRHVRKKCV